MNRNVLRNKIKFIVGNVLSEGTSSYLPGYSDDSTADTLSHIREKTSKVLNDELKKLEKEVIKTKTEEQVFWSEWLYANLITTSLKDGFFIEIKLIEKAIKLYNECLSDENIKQYTEDSYALFRTQIKTTVDKLKKLKPIDKDYFYSPGL